MITSAFFQNDTKQVAKKLLGKVLRVKFNSIWLSIQIIETEAYYLREKASHASLGYTEKRKALFMPPGTIYMYYARGGDSFNISCRGKGNAVLIKSGIPFLKGKTKQEAKKMIRVMQRLNPIKGSTRCRKAEKLCSGQTLLCRSLGLKVYQWDRKSFDKDAFYIEDVGYRTKKIIQTSRLGIPEGRDGHLLYRFIDYDHARSCTSNPLTKRNGQEGEDYVFLA